MKNKVSTIFTFFIIIMPIINQYESPIKGIGIGELIFLLLVPFMLLTLVDIKIKLNMYAVFFAYTCVISFVVLPFQRSYSINDVTFRLIRESFYFIIFLILSQIYFKFKFALRTYNFFSALVCAYLILQSIAFNIFNKILPWYISSLSFSTAVDKDYYIEHFQSMYTYFYRPSSIFLEPALFAQYVFPSLVFSLFFHKDNESSKIPFALFVSMALILSTSGESIVILAFLWSCWFLKSFLKSKNIIYTIILTFSLVIAAFLVLYNYNSNVSFQNTISRFSTFNLEGGSSSVNMRVLRGFFVFKDLNLQFKIFGVGFGNLVSHLLEYGITTPFDVTPGMEYMNTFSYILVSGGIVGASLFLITMYRIFMRSQTVSRYLIIILLMLCLIASIYSSPTWILYMVFILYSNREDLDNEVIISYERGEAL